MVKDTYYFLDNIILNKDKSFLIGCARFGWPTPHAGKFNPVAPIGAYFNHQEIENWGISIRNNLKGRKYV